MILVQNNLWTEADDESLLEQYRKEVDKEFSIYENFEPYKLDDVFQYLYTEMPEELKKQKVAYEKFLNWKEARK